MRQGRRFMRLIPEAHSLGFEIVDRTRLGVAVLDRRPTERTTPTMDLDRRNIRVPRYDGRFATSAAFQRRHNRNLVWRPLSCNLAPSSSFLLCST